jgi:hypothetical protein
MTPPPITSPAYTPGPWYVSESLKRGFCIRSARGGFLAWAATGSDRRDAANAQIMAAAPRFLHYSKLLLADVSRMTQDPDSCPEWNWRLTENNLRALIALAEGDPSYVRRPTFAATSA